jgi:alpha-beta hydrolase superfamily lysophospholipase
MQWYFWIIIFAAIVVLYWLVASFIMLKCATRPRRSHSEKVKRLYTERYRPDVEHLLSVPKTPFEVISHGDIISGEIFLQHGAEKTVILSHGFLAERTSIAHYARMYMNFGYNVVVYDQRYFGNSSGKICSLGYFERDDLIAVVQKVKEMLPDTKIILHGESMGAATVLLSLPHLDDVLFAVADCGYSDTEVLFRYILKKVTHIPVTFPVAELFFLWARLLYGYRPESVKPIDAVKESFVPILFIHGADDKFVPTEMSKQMFTVAKNPLTELYIAENAKHALSFYSNPQKYVRIVSDFDHKVSKNKDT